MPLTSLNRTRRLVATPLRIAASFVAVPILAVACASPPLAPTKPPTPLRDAKQDPGACHDTAPGTASMSAADLPLRSVGVPRDGAWILDENGYAGAFVGVKSPGPVTVTVRAFGHADQGAAPH